MAQMPASTWKVVLYLHTTVNCTVGSHVASIDLPMKSSYDSWFKRFPCPHRKILETAVKTTESEMYRLGKDRPCTGPSLGLWVNTSSDLLRGDRGLTDSILCSGRCH
ncbi:hypothetical protein DUNSADRAFT_12569 [Dunaliella salina]|uniref:Encoded protein n=1 Tax=Dunaliella salina TaxID=3046 RepID=A0ABQ7GB17_DUNSA|nr:hypothetical protein DUNSADRAFT_12569 [Dunaliella salina]|eukprot:KAF5831801.1 hypothetical protein DUNSADRAFT_12569 [Dunaliella salina]